MSYQPQFTITPALLARVEQIAALVGVLVYLQAYVPPFTAMVVK